MFSYVVIGIVALLAIFSFLLGTQQMIKLIIGNYVIGLLVLAFSMSLTIAIQFFQENPDSSWLGISYDKFEALFASGQVTLVLLLYLGALLLLFTQTEFNVSLPADDTSKNIVMILLIPLTIFSIVLGLEIAIFGQKLFNVEELVVFSTKLTENPVMYNFLVLSPVWLLVHSGLTVYLLTLLQIGDKPYTPPTPESSFE